MEILLLTDHFLQVLYTSPIKTFIATILIPKAADRGKISNPFHVFKSSKKDVWYLTKININSNKLILKLWPTR